MSANELEKVFEFNGFCEDELDELCTYLSSKEFKICQIRRRDIFEQLPMIIGPADPLEAQHSFPRSIRAHYGLDRMRNAVYFAPNSEIFHHQHRLLFVEQKQPLFSSHKSQNTFDYVQHKLRQYQSEQKEKEKNENLNDDAIMLLSYAITSNKVLHSQVNDGLISNGFDVIDTRTKHNFVQMRIMSQNEDIFLMNHRLHCVLLKNAYF